MRPAPQLLLGTGFADRHGDVPPPAAYRDARHGRGIERDAKRRGRAAARPEAAHLVEEEALLVVAADSPPSSTGRAPPFTALRMRPTMPRR
jgi:hypothetical protein